MVIENCRGKKIYLFQYEQPPNRHCVLSNNSIATFLFEMGDRKLARNEMHLTIKKVVPPQDGTNRYHQGTNRVPTG